MESRGNARKKKKGSGSQSSAFSSSSDMISELPGPIIEEILARLPIRDAVRTSALSSRWRHRWHSVPSVSFDQSCLPSQFRTAHSESRRRWPYLVRAVDHVLTLHLGQVRAFRLSLDDPGGYDVARWLLYVRRRLVEVIVLAFKGSAPSPCKLPSHLFDCDNLRKLSLSGCLFHVPNRFPGFKNLRVLLLDNVRFAGDGFRRLISGSPALWELSLDTVVGCCGLSISSPELEVFRICHTSITNLSFVDTPRLARATIGLECECNILEAARALRSLTTLNLQEESLLVLAKFSTLDDGLTSKYDRLTALHMDIDFASCDESLIAISLLRASPLLQKLSIQASGTHAGSSLFEDQDSEDLSSGEVAGRPRTCIWEDDRRLGFSLDRLTEANIIGTFGSRPEMNFIRFILASSPALRRMNVDIPIVFRISNVFKELLQFRRASAMAEVIFSDKAAPRQKSGISKGYCYDRYGIEGWED